MKSSPPLRHPHPRPAALLSPILSPILAALALLSLTTVAAAQQTLTAGLVTPFKVDRTPGGNLVIAETGTGNHDGEVTLVASWGGKVRLLSGLPSGAGPEAPIGPTAVVDQHRTLYVLIGEGDVLGPSEPPALAPNPDGLTAPIYSALLRAVFDPVPDAIREGFELDPEIYQTLADGLVVRLTNDSGEQVDLEVLADFRDLVPDPVSGVRQSNTFALGLGGELTEGDLLELGGDLTPEEASFLARFRPDSPLGRRLRERTVLYVVDAGMNTVTAVSAATGRAVVLARLPFTPNPLFPDLGGPVIEAVPTGIHVGPEGLFVTRFAGFPFAPGTGSVVEIDRSTGEITEVLGGLTSPSDVLVEGDTIYVLELTTDLLGGAPGRLLRFDPGAAEPTVLAPVLIGGSAMVRTSAGELAVSESFTGRIQLVTEP